MPPDPYDAVRYPPIVHPQTHPDRLFVNATLFGLRPAPVERCRVLELGCGDGTNLIAIAFAHPGGECVGVDTSGAAVADGQALAAEVGLNNLSLRHADVMEIAPDFGQFDYVIAHGLYSWVPPDVRDKVMQICGANLAPGGVAYVSYGALPGAQFRMMLRGMMQYHVRQFPDPVDQVRQAKGLLNFLADAQPQQPAPGSAQGAGGDNPAQAYARRRNDIYRQTIRNELDHMTRVPPALVFHDDLSTFNTPVFFHEFAAHAARHGLQYLAEADFGETQPPVRGAPTSMPPEVTRVLDQLPAGDVVAREQYADFVKCRQFRQTLLCRAGVALERPPAAERVKTLYASSPARPLSANADPRSPAPEQFENAGRGTFTLAHPVAKTVVTELGKAWPRPLHFDELLDRWRGGGGAADPAADARAVAELLLTGYAANVIGLHAHAPQVAAAAGDRPVASALARAQSRRRMLLTNLAGTPVDLAGEIAPRLLRLLDGTRDRDGLAKDLAEACRRDAVGVENNGNPVTDPVEAVAHLRGEVDRHLQSMARLALLVE